MTQPLSKRWNINNPKVVHEILEEEVVVINLDTGSYYSLDRVGTDVWALIETGATTDEIVQHIGHQYEGDPSEMELAIVRLLEEMQQEGLVAADEASPVASEVDLAGPRATVPGSEKGPFEAPTLRKYTDMQELLLLDPIHEVDDAGWPMRGDRPPGPEAPDVTRSNAR